jgi:SAM-dependent methyltransferase
VVSDPGDRADGQRGDRPPAKRSLGPLLRERLETALDRVEAAAAGRPLVALDAGCGERTAFRAVRARIGRLIGVDVHPPGEQGPDVDEFLVADLCAGPLPIPDGSVDVAASIFTVEHFADPGTALRTIARALAPHGRLVLVTVNRRHPFVAAYFAVPGRLRTRLQRLVKRTAAEAHPLVGACNDPAALRATLAAAGFVVEALDSVGHLSAAWGRRRATRLLGQLGDRLAAPFPSRRSTIVVLARRGPAAEPATASTHPERPASPREGGSR